MREIERKEKQKREVCVWRERREKCVWREQRETLESREKREREKRKEIELEKDVKGMTREISIQGEGDGTSCAVVNQLWAWLFTNSNKKISMHQQLILQLVDNCTSGILTFPLYRDFPVFLRVLCSNLKLRNLIFFSV